MNDEAKRRMFLFTVAGLACVGLALSTALVVALRQAGVPWWISTISLPLGLGTGLLSVTIAARMWRF